MMSTQKAAMTQPFSNFQHDEDHVDPNLIHQADVTQPVSKEFFKEMRWGLGSLWSSVPGIRTSTSDFHKAIQCDQCVK